MSFPVVLFLATVPALGDGAAGTAAGLDAPSIPAPGSSGKLWSPEPPPADCLRAVRAARIAHRSGQPERAVTLLREAVRAYPREILPLYALLDVHRELGHGEEETEATRALLRERILDPEARVPLSTFVKMIRVGDLAAGELAAIRTRLEREVASRDPPPERMLQALAVVQEREGNLAGARAVVARLLERSPSNTLRWIAYRMDVELERYESALAMLEALERDDRYVVWAADLARIRVLGRLGRAEEALEVSAAMEARHAEESEAWTGSYAVEMLLDLGWSLRAAGRHEASRMAFERAARMGPDHPEAKQALVYLFATAEERAAMTRAIDEELAGSEDADALFHEGSNRLATGDFEGAIGLLERAVAADPSLELAWFNLGVAALRLERNERAVEALGRARALRPDRPETRLNLGTALAVVDRCDEAVAILDPLVVEFPEMKSAQYYRYTCHTRLGDEAAAAAALEAYQGE